MTPLDNLGGNAEMPREERRTYECSVCGCGIARPDDRVHNGYGWAHATCIDDPWQNGGRP